MKKAISLPRHVRAMFACLLALLPLQALADTVLITGANSGIGLEFAKQYAAKGWSVIATHRRDDTPDTLKALVQQHKNVRVEKMDVTDRAQINALAKKLAGTPIDVLINNAGIMPPLGNFADMRIADIDTALEVNVSAAILLTRLVVPQMRERQSGHILFTGSSAAHAAFPNVAVYSATKAAIAGFAAALRADLSPFGIRVTEIVPGRVETQLYKDILDAETRAAMYAGNVAVHH